jgi:hypothetical protein
MWHKVPDEGIDAVSQGIMRLFIPVSWFIHYL